MGQMNRMGRLLPRGLQTLLPIRTAARSKESLKPLSTVVRLGFFSLSLLGMSSFSPVLFLSLPYMAPV